MKNAIPDSPGRAMYINAYADSCMGRTGGCSEEKQKRLAMRYDEWDVRREAAWHWEGKSIIRNELTRSY